MAHLRLVDVRDGRELPGAVGERLAVVLAAREHAHLPGEGDAVRAPVAGRGEGVHLVP